MHTPVRRASCPSRSSPRARPPAVTDRRRPRTTLALRSGDASRSRASTPTSSRRSIVEPVLQGAGGMHVYSPTPCGVLRRAGRRARRSGHLRRDRHRVRAHRQRCSPPTGAASRPDIMCVGKALTGGYLTLAATLCTAEVAARVSGGASGALMHGPTFMANPLACAVAAGQPGPAGDERLARADRRPHRGRAAAGLAPARGPRRGRGRARARRRRRDPAAASRSTCRGRGRGASSAACGCDRSATSSTPCRRTSPVGARPGHALRRARRCRGRGAPMTTPREQLIA